MEPRPFDRGKTVRANLDLNELQWSHGLSTVETTTGMQNDETRQQLLQWSHGLSTVETLIRQNPGSGSVHLPASMEPRPFDRGNSAKSGSGKSESPGFNGATAFRPWKPVNPNPGGNAGTALQWSHGLSTVETG